MTLYDFLDNQYNNLKESLYRLNKTAYNIINGVSFDSIIDDDEKCMNLILSELDFHNEISKNNRNRASHILVTWLLGLGMGNCFGINANAFNASNSPFCNNYFDRLWLLSAFLHDYGYFCKELSNPKTKIDELQEKYPLLVDQYDDTLIGGELRYLNGMTKNEFACNFTYSFDEIINYFNLRREDLSITEREAGIELLDHGIIGGCIAFKRYCERINRGFSKGLYPSISEMQIYKVACIISASHNIFKANKKNDVKYIKYGLSKLTSDAPVRVTKNNPLLFLISLVDTIECTKRFSAKSNKDNYLQQKTTLKFVNIKCSTKEIFLDYTPLHNHLVKTKREERMDDILLRHIKGILNFSSWTDFTAKSINKYSLSIKEKT